MPKSAFSDLGEKPNLGDHLNRCGDDACMNENDHDHGHDGDGPFDACTRHPLCLVQALVMIPKTQSFRRPVGVFRKCFLASKSAF